MNDSVKYKIVSLLAPCKETGEAMLKVQVVGETWTFVKKARELHKEHWLEDF